MSYRIVFILFVLLLASCSSKKGPEQVLADYVQYRFSQHQNKHEILQKTTGALQEQLKSQSDEEFVKFGEKIKDFKKRKLKIHLKKCIEERCYLTYTVFYDIVRDGGKEFSIEVKKIATIDWNEDGWKISDVSNIKTFINSKEIQTK